MNRARVAAAIVLIICLSAGVGANEDETFKHGNELEQVKRENTTLSELMWDSATDLLLEAWNTTFIAGVKAGDMDPNFYGQYWTQDGGWLREVSLLWEQLSSDESVPDVVRAYAIARSQSWHRYSAELLELWHIKDDGGSDYGIILQEAPTNYVNFIREAMLQHPPNVMIATYACAKLWANLTQELYDYINSSEKNCSNPYLVWVNENIGNGSAIRQAAAIDEWDREYGWYNWAEAVSMFRRAMQSEINFFNMKTGAALAKRVYRALE